MGNFQELFNQLKLSKGLKTVFKSFEVRRAKLFENFPMFYKIAIPLFSAVCIVTREALGESFTLAKKFGKSFSLSQIRREVFCCGLQIPPFSFSVIFHLVCGNFSN